MSPSIPYPPPLHKKGTRRKRLHPRYQQAHDRHGNCRRGSRPLGAAPTSQGLWFCTRDQAARIRQRVLRHWGIWGRVLSRAIVEGAERGRYCFVHGSRGPCRVFGYKVACWWWGGGIRIALLCPFGEGREDCMPCHALCMLV